MRFEPEHVRRAGATSHTSHDALSGLTDDELLRMRICDLTLDLESSMPGAQVRGLYRDLAQAGLRYFKPDAYLGDEWFSPEGVSAIALPFYLAHPRLSALESTFMQVVEGGRPAWCRRLLRHE